MSCGRDGVGQLGDGLWWAGGYHRHSLTFAVLESSQSGSQVTAVISAIAVCSIILFAGILFRILRKRQASRK